MLPARARRFGPVGLLAVLLGGLAAWAIVTRPAIALAALAVIALGAALLTRRANLLVAAALAALAVANSGLVPTPHGTATVLAKFAPVAFLASLRFLRRPGPGGPAIPQLSIPLLTIAAVAVLSASYSADPRLTLVAAVAFMVLVVATAISLPSQWSTTDAVEATLRTAFWVALGLIVAGFLPAGVQEPFLGGRFRGLFANPNSIGYLAAPTLPLGMLVVSRGSARTRVVASAGMAVALFAVVLSGSRGGLLSALVGIVAGFAAMRGGTRAFVVVMVLIGAAAFPLVRSADAIESFRPGTREALFQLGTGSGRLPAWDEAVRIIALRPLGGWGFATAEVVFPRLASDDLPHAYVSSLGGHPHNDYLEVALELGIPVAAALVVALLWTAAVAFSIARAGGPLAVAGAAVLGAVVGGMVESVFETGISGVGGMFAFPFLVVLAAAWSLRAHTRQHEPRAGARPLPARVPA